MPKHVVILGAGPSGLSAGWELSKGGALVDILEMESQVGGLCRSSIRGNFIFDLGGHRFVTKDNLVLAQIEGLMSNMLLVRPRKSVIRLHGKFFDYPLELSDVLRKMNLGISLKLIRDFFLTKFGAYSKMQDISFENWIVKRFGRTMYDVYFRPYSHKLWGLPPSQISADWAAQRISLINFTDVLLRALGKKKDTPKTYARNFLYPKKGIGQISDCMAEEIKKKCGRIHLNAKVKQIILENNRIKEVVYIQDNKIRKISGDFIISTIPLPEFILSIQPKLEDRVLSIAKTMGFRSVKFLHLMLNVENVSDNTWMYIPEEKYFFFRIQDRRNWSPTTVPDGKNALTLEIACKRGDSIWDAPDEEIFEHCMRDLEALKLVKRDAVVDYFAEKAEHAYPIYSLDYQNRIKTMYNILSQIRDFISIGRQGLYRYNNMDHSLKMGILSAKHILHAYPRQEIFEIATENITFDWSDPGYYDRRAD